MPRAALGSLCLHLANPTKKLQKFARDVAKGLSELLNKTVTDGVRLKVLLNDRQQAVVGYEVNQLKPSGAPVPLRLRGAKEKFALWVIFTFDLDPSSGKLRTVKNHFELQHADAEMIISYDYNREPTNKYSDPHIHLPGKARAIKRMLKVIGREKDKIEDLHFPVGSALFRLCLEDLIEFLILEGIVPGRPGWEVALKDSRDAFHKIQAGAVAREWPETVAKELVATGWDVAAPAV